MAEHEHTIHLPLTGELDVTNASTIRAEIDGVADANPGAVLELDMAAVTFVDSSALGALVGGLHHVRAQGGDIVLRNVEDGVRKVFRATGLDRVFSLGDAA